MAVQYREEVAIIVIIKAHAKFVLFLMVKVLLQLTMDSDEGKNGQP